MLGFYTCLCPVNITFGEGTFDLFKNEWSQR